MFQDAVTSIYNAFVPLKRKAMRKALKAWVKSGCVMRLPLEPKFPWADQ